MSRITESFGTVQAATIAVAIIVVWAVSGPLFGFSDTWQLIINTFTTLVTFLMVFIIQNTQNRESRAIQVKLDDILYAIQRGDDSLVGIEDLPERDIKRMQDRIRSAASSATTEGIEQGLSSKRN